MFLKSRFVRNLQNLHSTLFYFIFRRLKRTFQYQGAIASAQNGISIGLSNGIKSTNGISTEPSNGISIGSSNSISIESSNDISIEYFFEQIKREFRIANAGPILDQSIIKEIIRSHQTGNLENYSNNLRLILPHIGEVVKNFSQYNMFFRSLCSEDQEILLKNNVVLYLFYILAKFFGAENGHRQLEVLLGPNILDFGEYNSYFISSFDYSPKTFISYDYELFPELSTVQKNT